MTPRSLQGLVAVLLLAGCTVGGGSLCDADALADALGRAGPGDTVTVGACRIEGAFVVPAGVRLSGAGPGATVLAGRGEQPVIELQPGGVEPTALAELTVESAGAWGVRAQGPGAASLEAVYVDESRGVAMEFSDLDGLVMRDVELAGAVTSENAFSLGPSPSAAETSTFGLVLSGVRGAVLDGVWASGFATAGAALVDSEVAWDDGGVVDNLGLGLLVDGGAVSLASLELCGTMLGALPVAFDVALIDGVRAWTTDLLVCDSEGLGLVQDASSARHERIEVRDNDGPGLWTQGSPRFELIGGTISGNGAAGLYLGEVGFTRVDDVRVEATHSHLAIVDGEMGSAPIGDGVQLVRPAGRFVLGGSSSSTTSAPGS
jgi:hypothetical protein